MAAGGGSLRIEQLSVDEALVLIVDGTLDLRSYAVLRDMLIKSALEVPRAVIVDIAALRVPTPATLAVFPTVWMRVSEWPGVPIVLVDPDPESRRRLRQHGVTSFVPAFAGLDEALSSLGQPQSGPRRSVVELPGSGLACARARDFVHRTCQRWGCGGQLAQDARTVADSLVTNAVQHGRGELTLRLELHRGRLTVAVYDAGPEFMPAGRAGPQTRLGLGLMLVDALATAWGSAPTPSAGKLVWATLSPIGNRPGQPLE